MTQGGTAFPQMGAAPAHGTPGAHVPQAHQLAYQAPPAHPYAQPMYAPPANYAMGAAPQAHAIGQGHPPPPVMAPAHYYYPAYPQPGPPPHGGGYGPAHLPASPYNSIGQPVEEVTLPAQDNDGLPTGIAAIADASEDKVRICKLVNHVRASRPLALSASPLQPGAASEFFAFMQELLDFLEDDNKGSPRVLLRAPDWQHDLIMRDGSIGPGDTRSPAQKQRTRHHYRRVASSIFHFVLCCIQNKTVYARIHSRTSGFFGDGIGALRALTAMFAVNDPSEENRLVTALSRFNDTVAPDLKVDAYHLQLTDLINEITLR